jgi:N-methylhydantoinase A/oxoprolinase/acetone carboxylase beta subunit
MRKVGIDIGGTFTDLTLADGQRTATYKLPSIPASPAKAALEGLATRRVGPHSAGAHPGPSYDAQGGMEPTGTDANVVLGFLNPAHLLAGGMIRARVYDRTLLRPGHVIEGPAIVEQLDSTTIIPPAMYAAVDGYEKLLVGRAVWRQHGWRRSDHL